MAMNIPSYWSFKKTLSKIKRITIFIVFISTKEKGFKRTKINDLEWNSFERTSVWSQNKEYVGGAITSSLNSLSKLFVQRSFKLFGQVWTKKILCLLSLHFFCTLSHSYLHPFFKTVCSTGFEKGCKLVLSELLIVCLPELLILCLPVFRLTSICDHIKLKQENNSE